MAAQQEDEGRSVFFKTEQKVLTDSKKLGPRSLLIIKFSPPPLPINRLGLLA